MKKPLLFVVGFLMAYAVQSQDTLSVAFSAKSDAIVSRFTRELSLDEKQQKKVYTILQKRWKSIAKSKMSGSQGNRLMANEKTVSDLKKVFTPEQYNIFVALREERNRQKEVFRAQSPNYIFKEDDKDLDF